MLKELDGSLSVSIASPLANYQPIETSSLLSNCSFFFSVYVFDPATPRPVAVQSNVSKKADVVSAAFDPGYLSCSSTKDHPIKMSKLYFLNHNQVSLLCLVYCFNQCKRKSSQEASRCFKKTALQIPTTN